MALNCKIGHTKPLIDIVKVFLLYTYQDGEKYLPNYLKMAQDIYTDLQFNILRSEVKKIYTIEKKLGTVKLPDDLLYWQQIEGIDEKGKLIPLLENHNKLLPFQEEIVVKNSCPNPKCITDICSDVRSITATQEVVEFDGVEYTNITQTQLLPDGSIIEEVCRWYTTGVEISDYRASLGSSIGNSITSIKINGIDYFAGASSLDAQANENSFNALGLGLFSCVITSGLLVITSIGNLNNVQSVHITGFATYDEPFIETNTRLEVLNRCNIEQKCKVEVDEVGCIEDTVDNTDIVKKTFFNFDCCDKTLIPPTVSQLDGTLYFSNLNYDKVVITYKTSGINFAQTLLVPDIAETAMVSGLKYFSIKHKRVSEAEKQSARKVYNIDKNKLIEMLYPMRVQEFINASIVKSIIY